MASPTTLEKEDTKVFTTWLYNTFLPYLDTTVKFNCNSMKYYYEPTAYVYSHTPVLKHLSEDKVRSTVHSAVAKLLCTERDITSYETACVASGRDDRCIYRISITILISDECLHRDRNTRYEACKGYFRDRVHTHVSKLFNTLTEDPSIKIKNGYIADTMRLFETTLGTTQETTDLYSLLCNKQSPCDDSHEELFPYFIDDLATILEEEITKVSRQWILVNIKYDDDGISMKLTIDVSRLL